MNNDLISREALKEATKSFVDCDGFNPVWQIIDNAPTVAVNCKDCDGYEAGYSAGLKDAERPKTDILEQIIAEINSSNRGTCDYYIVDRIEEIINEYQKGGEGNR